MEIVYPEKERLLGTQTTPYVHDYLDNCAQLQRYALPVGLGNGQRYHGLGDMAKAEPGKHVFIPGEFNSLTGLRGRKTMQLPHTYHLGHKEKATGKSFKTKTAAVSCVFTTLTPIMKIMANVAAERLTGGASTSLDDGAPASGCGAGVLPWSTRGVDSTLALLGARGSRAVAVGVASMAGGGRR